MATAQVPKTNVKQVTINGQTMTMKNTTIHNHDMIEFDVAPHSHKFCVLTICAIDYTDTDTDMNTMELKSKKGGGGTPLGTIKIGS